MGDGMIPIRLKTRIQPRMDTRGQPRDGAFADQVQFACPLTWVAMPFSAVDAAAA